MDPNQTNRPSPARFPSPLLRRISCGLSMALAISGFFLCCASPASAETEPNNTAGTANALGLNATETGTMPNSDDDYFVITNTPASDFIKIDLDFSASGSGSDTLRMNVYGPNSSTTELANLITGTGPIETRYKATYTIATPTPGAQYFVRIRKQTADGTKNYTLTTTAPATPPPPPPGIHYTEDFKFFDLTGRPTVAVDGDIVLLGYSGADGNVAGSGAVLVYRKSGGTWIADPSLAASGGKLVASDGELSDSFGTSVAISGNTVVIGATGDDDAANGAGAAYIFRYSGGGWIQERKIVASDPVANSSFGDEVAISGTLAVVSRSGGSSRIGAAYVFRNTAGTTWTQDSKLVGSDAIDTDGSPSVGISNDVVIMGYEQTYHLTPGNGKAFIFRNTVGTTWMEEKKLTASDGMLEDRFGQSVGVSNGVAIVGASGNGASGAAYVYRNTPGTPTWAETKLTPTDTFYSSAYGAYLAISGDVAVVGDYVSRFNNGSEIKNNVGSAYICRWNGAMWSQSKIGTSGDAVGEGIYSWPITMSADYVLGGAEGAEGIPGTGIYHGAAFLHNLAPAITWAPPAPITTTTPLSATQLNASAGMVAGTFAYSHPIGTLLPLGDTLLTATFTPDDTDRYAPSAASVTINVTRGVPVITWFPRGPLTVGQAISANQLNASTGGVPGIFAYSSPSASPLQIGTLLPLGMHTLNVTFTPTDTARYAPSMESAVLNVTPFVPAMEIGPVPFSDQLSFVGDLGNAPRLIRQADSRVATFEAFELVPSFPFSKTGVPTSDRTGSLWYKWTAPSAGTYHIAELDPGDLVDLYRSTGGIPGALLPQSSGFRHAFTAAAGESFFIRHTSYKVPATAPAPVGFILRKEDSGNVTDFGTRKCIGAYMTSFGTTNSEKYRWTVAETGNYRVTAGGSSGTISLTRNSAPVSGFGFSQTTSRAFTAGDVLEITLGGQIGFSSLTYVRISPAGPDLGSVTSTQVQMLPPSGTEWLWTAPANGFLRLNFESTSARNNLKLVNKTTLATEVLETHAADTDPLTLGFPGVLVSKVTSGTTYGFSQFATSGGTGGCIALSFNATPTTTNDLIEAALAALALKSQAGVMEADGYVGSALGLEPTNADANVLKAIILLALLQTQPEYNGFLNSLDVMNPKPNPLTPSYGFTKDIGGYPVFPATVTASASYGNLHQLLNPTLTEINGNLTTAIASGTRRNYLPGFKAGLGYSFDKGDLMGMCGAVETAQAGLELGLAYNFGGSMNAYSQLERDGHLDLEHAVAQFPDLLEISDRTAIDRFKTRIGTANTMFQAAINYSSASRAGFGNHPFPPVKRPQDGQSMGDFLRISYKFGEALDHPVYIENQRVDLSRWNASSPSPRSFLPGLRGNAGVGFSAPDTTLGGILPDSDLLGFDRLLGTTLTLADPNGFVSWISGFGLPSGLRKFFDDGDGDGDTNGNEYYFASNPGNPSIRVQAPIASLATTPGGKRFRTSFVRRIGGADVRYVVACSKNLGTWDYTENNVTMVGSPVPVGDGQGEVVTVEIGGDITDYEFVRIHAMAKF